MRPWAQTRKDTVGWQGYLMIDQITQKAIESAAQSSTEYPVDFDRAWKWIGYTRKDNAKRALLGNFQKDRDFSSVLITEERDIGATRRYEIRLTKDCFKELAMMAGTTKGKTVRQYFIQCETRLQNMASRGLDDFPDDLVVAKAMDLMKNRIHALESANAEMLPDYRAHQILTMTKGTYSFREAAHMISNRIGYQIGEKKLRAKAVSMGLLDRKKKAYQRHIDGGLIEAVMAPIQSLNTSALQIRLTAKGVDWLVKRLLAESGQIPALALALGDPEHHD